MKTLAIWIFFVVAVTLAVVSTGCRKGSGTGEGQPAGSSTTVHGQENPSMPDEAAPSSQDSARSSFTPASGGEPQTQPSNAMVQERSSGASSSPAQPQQGAASSQEDEGDVRLGRMVRGLFRAATSAVPGVSGREESQTKTEEAPSFNSNPPQN
ncbi:hypothetical protein [Thermogutta sp.]|jgi:hypothetical protein|uniref:hypothetical protein n=1 Tax=Thermogutta sp. TaxID=1962930 RepID=UPI0032201BFA